MTDLSTRAPYSAIVDRPALALPDGKRVAVWVIVNVEHWRSDRAMPRTVLPPPMGQPLLPDVPNWAWHEYGMRVGYWRFHEVLARYGIRATLAINGRVCESYPRVATAALDAQWEFIGHGYVQGPMHHLDNQPEAIAQTINAISRFTGQAPRGWESPGLTETEDTLEWLRQAGIDYVADWVLDDQPVWLQAEGGPVLSVPYTVEINDIAIYALQQHASPMLFERGRDQFDQLAREGEQSARVMAISIHPYITGVPHRIAYLDQLLNHIEQSGHATWMTGAQIADWYQAQHPAPAHD